MEFIIIRNVFIENRQIKKEVQLDHEVKEDSLSGLIERCQLELLQDTGKTIRGNHDIQFIAQISNKKVIKCPKEEKKIPLTMFYDGSDKKYLQKDMTIKGYIMNNMQQTERQLGNIDLNISEYINEDGEKMQLVFSLFDQYKKQCKMSFYLQFRREEDDNKSIQSSQTQTIKSGKQRKLSIDKRLNKPEPDLSQKYNQIKKYKKQDNTASQRSSIAKVKENQFKFNTQNSRIQEKESKLKPNYRKQADLSNNYEDRYGYDNIHKNLQTTPKKGNVYNEDKYKGQKNTINDSIDTYKHSEDYNRKPSASKESNIPKFKPKQTKQPSSKPEEQESAELKAYVLQRQLKEKDKQLERARIQIKDQQNLINTLLEQKNKALGSYQVKRYNQEIQNLKKQLLQSNIKISELETLNRSYDENHQQNLRLIDKTSKQLSYYKQLALSQKMRMARIMQKCLEEGDNDLISFMEENLLNDNNDQ